MKIFIMSIIVLITINLTLTTRQKNTYPPPTWTKQQNRDAVLVHLIEVPNRNTCPLNHRRDKYGTCRPVI